MQAGPGTGKTFGLKRRVLRLLHPDGEACDPNQVVICAFNRVIANQLKKEIEPMLNEYGLALPKIKTIHSLCSDMVGGHGRTLLPQEVEEMAYDIRERHPKLAKKLGFEIKFIKRAIREHESGLRSHPGLQDAVSDWLTDHSANLVGDLPRNIERRIANGEFPQYRFEHVIVDEFQDLTETEATLTIRLMANNGSFIALGDRKQSIYAFRGNDERGLDALPEIIGTQPTDIPLDECQRCPKSIVKLCNALMQIYDEPLVVISTEDGQIHNICDTTPLNETKSLAKEIVRVFREYPSEKHLVMVTRRKWGYDLKQEINKISTDVPVRTLFSEDILQTWSAREAFVFLSIVADPEDHVAIRDWLSYKEPTTDDKGYKAKERNSSAYCSLFEKVGPLTVTKIQKVINDQVSFKGKGKRGLILRIKRLINLLENVPNDASVPDIISKILDPTIWPSLDTETSDLSTQDITRLKAETLRMYAENNALDLKKIVNALRYRIAKREPIGDEQEDGIEIVTLWGAKGLTADFVYVLGLSHEALPGPYKPEETGLSEAEHNAEQKRLLYVSLTRAKKALVISRSRKIKRGEVNLLGLLMSRRGNKFYADLRFCDFLTHVPKKLLADAIPVEDWSGVSLI